MNSAAKSVFVFDFCLVLLASCFCLAVLTGCYRQATDATAASTQQRYTRIEPWKIDGVRPGQAFAEVKQLFGEPREIRGKTGPRTAFWAGRDTAVTYDQNGRVLEVMGSSVIAGDKTLVTSGANEVEVVQILGPGKVRKSSRPKGSGVISFGQEHIGTTLIYENGGVRFELPVFGEATGHFLARRSP